MFAKRCPGCRLARGSLCLQCLKRLSVNRTSGINFDAGAVSGIALVGYDSFAQQVVLAAKNGGRVDVLRDLGRLLASLWFTVGQLNDQPTVVSWIPASRAGRRARGYDQGRLLARAVADELNRLHRATVASGFIRVQPLFARVDNRRQTGQTRLERQSGPSLRWLGSGPIAHLMLVDDVVTTGSSMRSAASTAARNGVKHMDALAMATVD